MKFDRKSNTYDKNNSGIKYVCVCVCGDPSVTRFGLSNTSRITWIERV